MNIICTKASQTESTPGLRSVQDHLNHLLLLLTALSSTKEIKWYFSAARLKSTVLTYKVWRFMPYIHSPVNCILQHLCLKSPLVKLLSRSFFQVVFFS